MRIFLRNVLKVGIKDAIFWHTISPGGPISRDRIDAHCRALGRSMGRCMMIQQIDRYRALQKQQVRLIKILDNLP